MKLTVEPLGLEVLETRQTVDHREWTLLGDILLHEPKCDRFFFHQDWPKYLWKKYLAVICILFFIFQMLHHYSAPRQVQLAFQIWRIPKKPFNDTSIPSPGVCDVLVQNFILIVRCSKKYSFKMFIYWTGYPNLIQIPPSPQCQTKESNINFYLVPLKVPNAGNWNASTQKQDFWAAKFWIFSIYSYQVLS